MKRKVIFEMANDPEGITSVIYAIPKWTKINGFLEAPQFLFNVNAVEHNTGFSIGYRTEIIGRRSSNPEDRGQRAKPDVLAILWGKSPGFIEFDDAGRYSPDEKFPVAKDTLIALINKRYYGNFSFLYIPNDDGDIFASLWVYWDKDVVRGCLEGNEKDIKDLVKYLHEDKRCILKSDITIP